MSMFFIVLFLFFFKQKTAYEMRISDWSSDVCSSDLLLRIELLRIDQLLDHAQIDDREVLADEIVETALRDAHVERHLAAIEAVDRSARAAPLALLAAAGGLALARAGAASHAHQALPGTMVRAELVKLFTNG